MYRHLRRQEHIQQTSNVTPTMTGWNGKFELESSEKFDDFLKACGAGYLMRKAANASTPVIEITQEGDIFTIKTFTTFKNIEIKFTLGQEFEEIRAIDGLTMKTTVVKDGNNKLVSSQTGPGPSVDMTRELIEDANKIKVVSRIGDVVCTRVYKRI